jgi:hypothetical protein
MGNDALVWQTHVLLHPLVVVVLSEVAPHVSALSLRSELQDAPVH